MAEVTESQTNGRMNRFTPQEWKGKLPGDLVAPKKPLYSHRSERGSSSAPEGISSSDCTMEYLADLIKEKRQLEIFPQFFPHTERLIDEEITRVRTVPFHCSFTIEKVDLPEPEGDPITIQKKVYVPCKEHPDYNFVGRLLGPRGMTAKQLEQETGCKIMVRGRGFTIEKVDLPEPEGDPITIQKKVYVPCKEHPDYNFVGRLLGPRGMTAKQLEQETGCKIMVRGRGSMRNRCNYNFVGRLLGPRGMTAKQLEQETGCKIMVRGRGSMRNRCNEELKRGKPNCAHLDNDLHVLVQCEDTPNRVYLKLKTCAEQIKKLLVPTQEGADDLKRKQLMELAIFNGTYRPVKQMRGAQLVSPLSLVSPTRQPPSSLPSPPILVSPVGSPITSANNTGSAPTMNSFMQSPNIDYNMFMNQLSFDAAALTSLSMGNSDCQPQSSAFAATTPLMNAAVVPNPLQSYLLYSATISPPASTGSDHH
ncbi:Female germline-specific tumor suppressor gld-1 [Toxocara canis]|uniref:Female germline-specific tumor suppressor gld-1 n=1 Tax=Toxocara canis TaxID=6265 RepID=A0A0B2W051_TOXCA|nr:Female germline-specific tumor suppressor gld-1 [Toxocara canis]